MEDDRRSNYRAAAAESRPASLVIDGRRATGYIVDESSGGLCFLATSSFPAEENAQGALAEWDGVPIAVSVAYVEVTALRTRIGLRRNEGRPVRTHRQRTKLRPRVAIVVIGALAGVALGLLLVRFT